MIPRKIPKQDQSDDYTALFPKVLVGVDTLSNQTPRILNLTNVLARRLKAATIVCTVANVPTSVQGNDADGFPANNEERNILEKLQELIHEEFDSQSTRDLEIKILHGDPGERISEYADYSDCDLVIVGSRNQGALKKALLGSVSSTVASRCKRSVLIIK